MTVIRVAVVMMTAIIMRIWIHNITHYANRAVILVVGIPLLVMIIYDKIGRHDNKKAENDISTKEVD